MQSVLPETCTNFAQGVNLHAWSYREHVCQLLFYTESIIFSLTKLGNFNPSNTIIILSRKIIEAMEKLRIFLLLQEKSETR